MTIQIVKSDKVEMPASATAGRKADLPFEHSDIEVGQSVFVPGAENKNLVMRVYNNARRTYRVKGEQKFNEAGEALLTSKGKPMYHYSYDREFKVVHIEDGKVYDRKLAGQEGYALFRTK